MDAASERARFRDAVDRLRQSCGYSMEEVAAEFGRHAEHGAALALRDWLPQAARGVGGGAGGDG
jgi:transposase-like protein